MSSTRSESCAGGPATGGAHRSTQFPLRSRSASLLQSEADLEPDLEVRHLAVLDVPANGGHLEPVDLAQGLRSAPHTLADGVLNAVRRRADHFGHAVHVVTHAALAFGAASRASRGTRRAGTAIFGSPRSRGGCGLEGCARREVRAPLGEGTNEPG